MSKVAAIGRVVLTSIVLGVIILAFVGVFVTISRTTRPGNSLSGSQTTTSATNSNSASTSNITIGLNFTLTLSSTQLTDGQAINITAFVTNIRSAANNITGESNWAEIWFIGWGTIDSCNSFANAQVFEGYYTESNISSLQSGSELQLAKPLFPPLECPFIPGAWSTYFPFQPHENQVGYQYSTSGDYGNASSSSNSSTFHLFDTGIYTVAAGDEWGQLVLLHFNVTNNSVQTSRSNTINANTFFSTSCLISGVGGFAFRLVSDSTGSPVNATAMSAVDRLGCNSENQVVYLNQFSYLGDGWIVPIFPSQATVGGGLNITVSYQGKTYNFLGDYPPVGTDCVTLSVPSGNVSSTTVMNGSGSYCSQTDTISTSSSTTFSSSCSTSYFNGTDVVSTMFLSQKTGSSVNLCVRFFYYNSTSTATILPLQQLTIYSVVPSNGTLSNANSLFSISPTTSQFQIGGLQSENEGLQVNYTISATSSTPSGTYEIGLSSGLYPNYVICGYGIYVDLQVGNITNPTVGTSCHYVPAPMDNPGLVYTEIIRKSNSTA